MSDLKLHIYGGEGTRENSMYCACTHSMRRSHESWNPCANTFYCQIGCCCLWVPLLLRGKDRLSDLVKLGWFRGTGRWCTHVGLPWVLTTHGTRNWSPLTLTGDVNTVSSVPRRRRTAKPESEQRMDVQTTVAHFRRGRRAALPLAVPCRTLREPSRSAPLRPPDGRVGAALPLVCARSGRQTGEFCFRARVNKHRPCPAAAGRGGSRRCADGRRAPPLVPAGGLGLISCSAGTGPGLLGC